MRLSVSIGTRNDHFVADESRILNILHQNTVKTKYIGQDAVTHALDYPIDCAPLDQIVKSGETVAIITSDITRPMPTSVVLPIILERLHAGGVKDDQIVIVFALGNHRFQTKDEQRMLVGEKIMQRYRCIDSDQSDVIHLGVTSSGTPVDVTRVVAEADRRICLGNIEYHYFAGYSGGAKAIMPGCSTREAIQANHRFMVQDDASTGHMDPNPVRDDLEEGISRFCPIDAIINVVLDEKKQVIHAVYGHFIKAHRLGCKFLDQVYLKPIEQQADIVIVSQGGAPKDLNLYQTQKALDNSQYAVKDGGIIILVGSCQEGLGEEVFERWLSEAENSKELITRISKNFELGGHKAAAIALVLERARIFLVSDMDDEKVKSIFMEPYHTVQEALDAATDELGTDTSVIVMPYGGSTLPRTI